MTLDALLGVVVVILFAILRFFQILFCIERGDLAEFAPISFADLILALSLTERMTTFKHKRNRST